MIDDPYRYFSVLRRGPVQNGSLRLRNKERNVPFLADSVVEGGVAQDVNGLGTDLLLGTGLCPTGGRLLVVFCFEGVLGGVFFFDTAF